LKHTFGGPWTEEKLNCLEEYLKSYLSVMKNQSFRLVYIDAFSGTGQRYSREAEKDRSDLLRQEMFDLATEHAGFFEGSVLRALKLSPGFENFALIEKSSAKASQLRELKAEYEGGGRTINVLEGDANEQIMRICSQGDWTGRKTNRASRAVLFLDPFGCQVDWTTLQAIAHTRAIDVWYLFPSGLGVYRMLTSRQDKMAQSWAERLDLCLGTGEWRNEFFREESTQDLFGETTISRNKVATIDTVERFFIRRLSLLFPHVSNACLPLKNSRGFKMFSLCFAAANPGRGGQIAVGIASHLLGKGRRGRK
jgi:three-Cys-motif partner protein